MDLTTLKNRQIRLAQRPVGLPGPECWQRTEEAVSAPQAGGVLLQTVLPRNLQAHIGPDLIHPGQTCLTPARRPDLRTDAA